MPENKTENKYANGILFQITSKRYQYHTQARQNAKMKKDTYFRTLSAAATRNGALKYTIRDDAMSEKKSKKICK